MGDREEIIVERKQVEYEIREICQAIIHMLNVFLLPLAKNDEIKQIYTKKINEFYIYLSEIGAPKDIYDAGFFIV
uniref:Uncharacterized protein n=1 Tax=Ditylenchus dipsaci TaxID=166011 RepID=A0A915ESZ1_9BILA